jgi:DNA-binding PadR family transcriptional regulator
MLLANWFPTLVFRQKQMQHVLTMAIRQQHRYGDSLENERRSSGMYELIILAQLMRYPAHGYLIASIINDMIGPYARFSNGRLYPLLAKLEQDGLIALYTEGVPRDRQLRSYQITEAGRQRFYELMMNTTANPGEYQRLFAYKVTYFGFLQVVDRLYLIDHYINYCQTHLHHLTVESDDLARHADEWPGWSPAWTPYVLGATRHWLDLWRLELEWAKSLRARELAQNSTESQPKGTENSHHAEKIDFVS